MSLLLNNKRRKSSGIVDPYWNNVVLYMDGSSLNDTSISPKTITNTNVTVSSSQSKYGGSSLLFNAISPSYLRLLSYSDTFTGDFTFESWVYIDNVASWNGVIFSTNNSLNFAIGALNLSNTFRTNLLGSEVRNVTVPYQSWFHLAFSRNGNGTNNCKTFLNGTAIHTFTRTGTLTIFNNLNIGTYNTSLYFMSGYLDSLRITKDIGRYSTNFNPETDTYLNV